MKKSYEVLVAFDKHVVGEVITLLEPQARYHVLQGRIQPVSQAAQSQSDSQGKRSDSVKKQ